MSALPPTPADRPGLLAELGWRGMVEIVSDGLAARLTEGPIRGYVGIDPTGPSLHVGHLVQVFLMTHLQRSGSVPVALVGGGTGMIGDPSGTSAERNLLADDTLAANRAAVRAQLGRFLDFEAGPHAALLMDNVAWLGEYRLLPFLREIGKHFTIAAMLEKESVQTRLGAGLSFAEFAYQTLQATDFLVLHRDHGVELQMGGSDQWGNISAGMDLIRRVEGRAEGGPPRAFGLCSPLLLNSGGAKMGKTAQGAVFLDPSLTSVYDFYQYAVDQPDDLIARLLRWLTLLPRERVEALEAEQAAHPEARAAQRAFAFDLTARVHGRAAAERQARVAEAAFGEAPLEDPEVLAELHAHAGGFDLTAEQVRGTLLPLLVTVGVYRSNGEGRRAIAQGGLRLNGVRVPSPDGPVPPLLHDRWLVARLGKKTVRVGRLREG